MLLPPFLLYSLWVNILCYCKIVGTCCFALSRMAMSQRHSDELYGIFLILAQRSLSLASASIESNATPSAAAAVECRPTGEGDKTNDKYELRRSFHLLWPQDALIWSQRDAQKARWEKIGWPTAVCVSSDGDVCFVADRRLGNDVLILMNIETAWKMVQSWWYIHIHLHWWLLLFNKKTQYEREDHLHSSPVALSQINPYNKFKHKSRYFDSAGREKP